MPTLQKKDWDFSKERDVVHFDGDDGDEIQRFRRDNHFSNALAFVPYAPNMTAVVENVVIMGLEGCRGLPT